MRKKVLKKKIDVAAILEENPNIDKELYYDVRKQQEELRASGLKRHQYNLAIPFMRRVRAVS